MYTVRLEYGPAAGFVMPGMVSTAAVPFPNEHAGPLRVMVSVRPDQAPDALQAANPWSSVTTNEPDTAKPVGKVTEIVSPATSAPP